MRAVGREAESLWTFAVGALNHPKEVCRLIEGCRGALATIPLLHDGEVKRNGEEEAAMIVRHLRRVGSGAARRASAAAFEAYQRRDRRHFGHRGDRHPRGRSAARPHGRCERSNVAFALLRSTAPKGNHSPPAKRVSGPSQAGPAPSPRSAHRVEQKTSDHGEVLHQMDRLWLAKYRAEHPKPVSRPRGHKGERDQAQRRP
jgi:hypothetical protein